jgi:hypothetical protein
MHSYPEIALVKRRPEIFAVKEVVAYEKLHGSQFRLFFPIGMTSIDEVQYGSHETIYTPEGDFPLGIAINWFKKRPELLTAMMDTIKAYGFSDVTVFGEAYGPGIKAKGVKYSLGQDMLFRAFAIMIGNNLATEDLLREMTTKMDLPLVTEVWRGAPTMENFDALLEKPSAESAINGLGSENIAEGVVIHSVPLLRNVFGEYLIVKHKSSKFSEVAQAPKDNTPRGPTPADNFALAYVTEGRVINAVGRLQDRGVVLANSMVDMPVLLTEIMLDLHKECQPEWDAAALEEKQVRGSVSKVLGPIYRQMISHD